MTNFEFADICLVSALLWALSGMFFAGFTYGEKETIKKVAKGDMATLNAVEVEKLKIEQKGRTQ